MGNQSNTNSMFHFETWFRIFSIIFCFSAIVATFAWTQFNISKANLKNHAGTIVIDGFHAQESINYLCQEQARSASKHKVSFSFEHLDSCHSLSLIQATTATLDLVEHRARIEENKTLKFENAQLKEKFNEMQSKFTKIKIRLKRVNEYAQKLKSLTDGRTKNSTTTLAQNQWHPLRQNTSLDIINFTHKLKQDCNVRTSPSSKGKKMLIVYKGSLQRAYKHSQKWMKLATPKGTGYISSHCLGQYTYELLPKYYFVRIPLRLQKASPFIETQLSSLNIGRETLLQYQNEIKPPLNQEALEYEHAMQKQENRSTAMGGPNYSLFDSLSLQFDQMTSDVIKSELGVSILLENLADKEDMIKSLPSLRPVYGRMTSSYGYRRSPFTGSPAMHDGVDIASKWGTTIQTPADGVVIYVGYDKGYGRYLAIDHGHNVITLYGHTSKIFVRVGQKVIRRDSIATVGSTGRSTGPHLHYEVRVNGVARNPSNFFLEL